MQSCWYIVIRSRGAWWVDCEGTQTGPYPDVAVATDAAVIRARLHGDRAKRLQVMVPGEGRRFDVVWER